MSAEAEATAMPDSSVGALPQGEALKQNVQTRQRYGNIWRGLLFGATAFGLIVLTVLFLNTINKTFGLIAVQEAVDSEVLTGGRPFGDLSEAELVTIIQENVTARIMRNLEREKPLIEYSQQELITVIENEIIKPQVVSAFTLLRSLFDQAGIATEVTAAYPRADIRWNSWVTWDFLTTPMSSVPAQAGVRTAVLGSLWVIFITMIVAFPVGIGAAIYLEEYANQKSRLNQLIQTNINNLAGVPSIIYGILGLAIFVRLLSAITSGVAFGVGDPTTANGRTILSAGLTMALLILPIIIISSQEAIRSVPSSIRQASYGLGATKWQTIWSHVLPMAFPGILTGTILAMSRAIGETAPLIVVGASTFIVTDPTGPFSKFTVLPIQIFDWTKRPQEQFQFVAAAAIIVLLVIMLTLNATAIWLRNKFRRSS